MEAVILDKNYENLDILDTFESFVWTDRLFGYGDFEVQVPASFRFLKSLKPGNYLWYRNSEHLMVIETVELKADIENGTKLIAQGRSLESLLDRRIIWNRTEIGGELQNGIRKLLMENAISPENDERVIPNLYFSYNEEIVSTSLDDLTVEMSYLGDNLYDVIRELCETYQVGFKITFDEESKRMIFRLYRGLDRSYAQNDRPWVIFSPDFDSMTNSDYYETKINLKTVALVGGTESDSHDQELVESLGLEGEGLDRRETYISARDIEYPRSLLTDEERTAIRDAVEAEGNQQGWTSDEIRAAQDEAVENANQDSINEQLPEYREQLASKGLIELTKTYITESFDAELNATRQYVYGVDYQIGDTVQVRNEYGIEAIALISEIVRSQDLNGEVLTPTFVVYDPGDEGFITFGTTQTMLESEGLKFYTVTYELE